MKLCYPHWHREKWREDLEQMKLNGLGMYTGRHSWQWANHAWAYSYLASFPSNAGWVVGGGGGVCRKTVLMNHSLLALFVVVTFCEMEFSLLAPILFLWVRGQSPVIQWAEHVSSLSWWVPTLCLDSIVSPLGLWWVKGVCTFTCNLPAALWQWLGWLQ